MLEFWGCLVSDVGGGGGMGLRVKMIIIGEVRGVVGRRGRGSVLFRLVLGWRFGGRGIFFYCFWIFKYYGISWFIGIFNE